MAGLSAMEAERAGREADLAGAKAAGLALDESAESERIRRLQARLSNKVLRAMGGLLKIQRQTNEPARAVPAVDSPSPDMVTASPFVATRSIDLRNEPNEPRAAVRNEPNEPGSGLRNEPNATDRGLNQWRRPAEEATKRTQRAPDESALRRDGTNPTRPGPAASGRPRTEEPGPPWAPSLPVPPRCTRPGVSAVPTGADTGWPGSEAEGRSPQVRGLRPPGAPPAAPAPTPPTPPPGLDLVDRRRNPPECFEVQPTRAKRKRGVRPQPPRPPSRRTR